MLIAFAISDSQIYWLRRTWVGDIEQDVVRISHKDSVEDLIQKGRDLEKGVLSRGVRWHIDNRVLLYGNKTVIFD